MIFSFNDCISKRFGLFVEFSKLCFVCLEPFSLVVLLLKESKNELFILQTVHRKRIQGNVADVRRGRQNPHPFYYSRIFFWFLRLFWSWRCSGRCLNVNWTTGTSWASFPTTTEASIAFYLEIDVLTCIFSHFRDTILGILLLYVLIVVHWTFCLSFGLISSLTA